VPELKLWTNDVDIVVAETAVEARQLLIDTMGLDEFDEKEDSFHEWEGATIRWHDECGYSEGVEMTPQELITKLGKGYSGSSEC
jgi:hypothetical protein